MANARPDSLGTDSPRTPQQIAEALRVGEVVPDVHFDALLPSSLRSASRQFWTPMAVAILAARWLAETNARRVLDVGSGCGKLCIVGALTSDLAFLGVEHRPHLIEVARQLAARFALEHRVAFHEGTADGLPFEDFDTLYFYNPFGENVFAEDEQLDVTVELSVERFTDDIHMMEEALVRMPVGARVLTYHGFGGRIPDTYDLVRSKKTRTGLLRMWSKTRTESAGKYWLETEDTALFREEHRR